jgi:hypothetical protein
MANFTQTVGASFGNFPAYGTAQFRYAEANYTIAPIQAVIDYTTSYPSNAWGLHNYTYNPYGAPDEPPNMFNLIIGSGGFG